MSNEAWDVDSGEGAALNIILVLSDTLRRDHVSTFGAPPERTPRLHEFGRRAHQFRNHFVGSLMTIPARREIFSGRRDFLWRPWGSLEPFDRPLARRLAERGYRTGFVTDNYHYWEQFGNGYLQSFQSTELIRGHEIDSWKPPLRDTEPMAHWAENVERWSNGQIRQYYANVKDFRGEEDFFPARVFSTAANWLHDHSSGGPFFLQVESFDVHDPFDVPEPYSSRYGDTAGRGRYRWWPPNKTPGAFGAYLATVPPEELAFVRSQYQGKVTMLDRWLGRLFDEIGQLGLWANTVVIVTSDHGHDLGDHGQYGKGFPHFDTHANIPLLIWHPRHASRPAGVDALTTTADLHATILELSGEVAPQEQASRSLVPLLRGGAKPVHEGLIYGIFGQGICCTDGEWTLIQPAREEAPLYYYSTSIYRPPASTQEIEAGHFVPGVDVPQWKVPFRVRQTGSEPMLFNRVEDPGQECSRWDEVAVRRRLQELARHVIEQDGGSPPELLERLGLASDPSPGPNQVRVQCQGRDRLCRTKR